MRWVTNEQLERARQISVLEYILRYESSAYKRVGRGYRLISDNAFAVDENGWYCHRKNIGSKTALDYLVEIKGYGLIEAVSTLLGESPQQGHTNGKKPIKLRNGARNPATSKKPIPDSRPPPNSGNAPLVLQANEHPKHPFILLPVRNKDNKRIIAYLQSREIDRGLIIACIERGVLFECRYYHNAVFLGKDENGKTRFAAIRSTTAKFMWDAKGSDKRYSFVIPPAILQGNGRNLLEITNAVAVFESPIEALSHQTMCLNGYIPAFNGWRLSLGGTSALGIEHFLRNNRHITCCFVCTNNDEAGDLAMSRIKLLEETLGITVVRSLPTQGNDWNDALVASKRVERTQKRGMDAR